MLGPLAPGAGSWRGDRNGEDRFLTYEENVEFVERNKFSLFMPATFSFLEEERVLRAFLIDAVPNLPGTDSITEAYLRVATDYDPVAENLPV